MCDANERDRERPRQREAETERAETQRAETHRCRICSRRLGNHTHTCFSLASLSQALAQGRRLEAGSDAVSYSIFELDKNDGSMQLKGSYPKKVNVDGAKVKFRRRTAKKGFGDTLLGAGGVGGMGDDVWRELLERENWGEIDDAWAKFRRELELGREFDVVDEQGDTVDFGADYTDDLTEPPDD